MAGEELEQGQTTMSEPFTEENLRRCTGIPEEQDLEATTSVDIQVDASENSLRTLGQVRRKCKVFIPHLFWLLPSWKRRETVERKGKP